MTVGLAPTLLWRRTHPFAVVAIAFGVAAVVDIGLIVADAPALDMYTMIYFLLLPYSLFRWGSGREAVAGLAIILVAGHARVLRQLDRFGDAIGGSRRPDERLRPGPGRAVPARRPGAAARAGEVARSGSMLARELHDTVAHHVSAIAIQAQAGRALAATSPAVVRSRRWR